MTAPSHRPDTLADILIVGGGLAGATAAIELARAGRSVHLFEAEPAPRHKVCGEFLSHEALGDLRALGVDTAALGAVAIERVRLARAHANQPPITAALPFAACSLTRRALDAELLRCAAAAGASVHRGVRVQSLTPADGRWSATLEDGSIVSAPHALLATGKHDLRGRARPAGVQRNLVGFKIYLRLSPEQQRELGSAVELVTYPGGYGGLQLVEHGAANLCCLIHQHALQQLSPSVGGDRWSALLAAMRAHSPLLDRRLTGAEPLLARPLTISSIPYGFVRRTTEPGLWALGDQAVVIPSFTGDGMSIALHSGRLAASMLLSGASSLAYQRRLYAECRGQVALATTLSRLLCWSPARRAVAPWLALFPGMLPLIAQGTRLRAAARQPLAFAANPHAAVPEPLH